MAGRKIADGALECFGQAGGVVWLKGSVVGDFKLELEVDLPGWTRDKLDVAATGRAPLPNGSGVVPPEAEWEKLASAKSAGQFSAIGLKKAMYALATYLEVDLAEKDKTWRVHVGGVGLDSPMDPKAWCDGKGISGTTSGVLATKVDPWKDDGQKLEITGSDVRCGLGKTSMVVMREGQGLTVDVGGIRIIDGCLPMGTEVRVGLGIHDGKRWRWGEAWGGPARAEVYTWQRFTKVILTKKPLAGHADLLDVAERNLAEGNWTLAEQNYRLINDTGSTEQAQARARIGLIRSIIMQGRMKDGMKEFSERVGLGMGTEEKCVVIGDLRKAGAQIDAGTFVDDEEMARAWGEFIVLQDRTSTSEMDRKIGAEGVKTLLSLVSSCCGKRIQIGGGVSQASRLREHSASGYAGRMPAVSWRSSPQARDRLAHNASAAAAVRCRRSDR